MKIEYHIPTQTVRVDLTPEEVGQLTPAVVDGLVKGLLRTLKEAGAAVLSLETQPIPDMGEAGEPVERSTFVKKPGAERDPP